MEIHPRGSSAPAELPSQIRMGTARLALTCIACAALVGLPTSAAQAKTTPAVWTAIASKLAGKYTPVSCGRLSRAYGITHTRGGKSRIVLDNAVCANLRVAPEGPWPVELHPRNSLFIAIQTLAHEAMHAKGISNENRAECEGLRHFVEVARALGFARWQAQGLLRFEVDQDRNLRCKL